MSESAASARHADGLSDVRSKAFASLSAQLRTTTAALKGAAVMFSEPSSSPAASAGALEEAFALYGRGLDLARTLQTICRTHLGLNAADTSAVSAKTAVAGWTLELKQSASPIFAALAALARIDPACAGSSALARWAALMQEKAVAPERTLNTDRIKAEIVMPAAALYTHLTAMMSVDVKGADGRSRRVGFGECTAILKNAADPSLRRSSFLALNAWLAEHASCFLDALNAVLGFRVCISGGSLEAICRHAFARDRTDPEILSALHRALESHLPDIRESVTLRAAAYGAGPMPLANVLAPAPLSLGAQERSFETAAADCLAAFERLSPSFQVFLSRALEAGWIDVRHFSRKSGNWCDDLPALDAVRVLANYVPTLAGEASLAHLLGAAYQMQVLHRSDACGRLCPIAATEIAANFCETAVFEHLRREAKAVCGTPEPRAEGGGAARHPVLGLGWQALRRITNCLLVLPARHRLLKSLYRERTKGALSLGQTVDLCAESWSHYFGPVTDGQERYLWAYKSHFYRIDPIFYDWQYTLGFLLSIALMRRFESAGKSFSGADLETVWLDSGRLSIEAFGRRHLGADLKREDFWNAAVEAALTPVYEAKTAIRRSNRSAAAVRA